MKNISPLFKHFDFIIIDILCLIISLLFSCLIRYNNLSLFISQYNQFIIAIIIINLLLIIFIEPYKNVLKRSYLQEFSRTLSFDILNFLVCILYLFISKSSSEYSRIVIVLTYILYFVLSYLIRTIYKRFLFNKRKKIYSLLVICNKNNVHDIVKKIKADYLLSLCIIDQDLKNKTIDGIKVVANKKDILDFISKNWIDEIFIACSYSLISQKIMNSIMVTNIPIHIKLDEIEIFRNRVQTIDTIGIYNTLTLSKRLYSFWEVFAKRLIDIVGSFVGCLITLILILFIGPIIYIKSPGNIFYVSERVGKNGKIFKFYKFRSMIINADGMKKNLEKSNRIKDGMMFKIDNDPRIIPVIGEFIRKTSIDEFPQFFNVLKNDMSLVGTRPPTLDEWNKYTPYYRSRLSIKPGITGLWQVSGRSEITNFDEVVKLDNDYIENWTLSLDIKIIFKTIIQIFNKKNGAM